jgi:proteasome lid subunit RPN8/RPN11
MIHISKDVYDEILAHAKESYPGECCGVLVGKPASDPTIVRAYRADNTNTERSRDRYEIDPEALFRIDREVRGEGHDILGFYHSHPDHPDTPSDFDRERGQAGYSYLIVAVQGGRETTVRSWAFEEEGEPFVEEEIKVI